MLRHPAPCPLSVGSASVCTLGAQSARGAVVSKVHRCVGAAFAVHQNIWAVGVGLRPGVATTHVRQTGCALNSGCLPSTRPPANFGSCCFLSSFLRRSTCPSLPGFLVYPSPSSSCSCFSEFFELACIHPSTQTTQTLCRSAKPAAQGFAFVRGLNAGSNRRFRLQKVRTNKKAAATMPAAFFIQVERWANARPASGPKRKPDLLFLVESF